MSNDYVLQWESPRLDFYWCYNFIYAVYSKKLIEGYLGFHENDFLVNCDEENFQFYLKESEINNTKIKAQKYFNNPDNITNYLKEVQVIMSEVISLSWEVEHLSLVELKNLIVHLESLFHKSVALHLCTQPHITNTLEDQLIDELKKKYSNDIVGEIIYNTTKIEELPNVLIEQKEWIELILKYSEDDFLNVHEVFSDHLLKWKYITAGDSHDPMTIEYLEKRAFLDLKDPDYLRKQLDKLQMIYSGRESVEIKKYEDKYLDSHLKDITQTIRTLGKIRFDTKSIWMKIWYLIETGRKSIEQSIGKPIEGFLSDEIDSLYTTDLHLNSRRNYILIKNGNSYFLYYNGLEKSAKQINIGKTNWREVSSVRGKVGYKGKVKGKVLKVDWNDKIQDKIQLITVDTILVLPQTTPAYIGLLNKCKGLIIDEGGITSHASIVTRELQIPSLIGTRFATKVFLDGDEVEIDTYSLSAKKI